MLGVEEEQKQLPEPVEPQHVEEQVQHVVVEKHVGEQRVGAVEQDGEVRRQFEVGCCRERAAQEYAAHVGEPYDQKQGDIDEDKLYRQLPCVVFEAQIIKNTHASCLLSCASRE